MKQLRLSFALLAIVVLIAAAVVPGGAALVALQAAALLLFPVTHVLAWLCSDGNATGHAAHDRASVLLRAPPASSINR